MMDVTPLMRPEQKIIQSYGAGFFRVNGVLFRSPVLVSGDQVAEWDDAQIPPSMTPQLEQFRTKTEIMLIGCGDRFSVLPPAKRAALSASLGIPFDVMDTPSACRTYNILTAEGRQVTAALIPVTG